MAVLCPICSSKTSKAFTALVLNKYQAEYENCSNCGYLRTVNPHWLDEAYTSAIAAADTGLVMRNISLAQKISAVLYWLLGNRGQLRCLDAAGGYGMLTRLMRDHGFDFYWSDKYCANLMAIGFEHHDADTKSYAAVTAIEVMEHLVDPVDFVRTTLAESGASTFIFTTELYNGEPPKPDAWWYYSFPTGQHIGFFQRQTLEKIAQQLDMHLVSANGLHVFSKRKFSERLMWFLTRPSVALLSSLVIRMKMNSKTVSDHERMLKSI